MTRWAAGIAAAAFGAAVAAQTPPPGPTFQSQVTYVELVVSVAGPAGAFVPGLTARDFEVIEDNVPQTIESLSMVDLAAEHAAGPAALAEPDVRGNERPFAGRIWVLALDAINTKADQTAKVQRIAKLFVERALGPDDLMAIVTLGDTATAVAAHQDLTSSRRLLFDAIDRFLSEGSESLVLPLPGAREPVILAQPSSGDVRPGEQLLASMEMERQGQALKSMRKLRTVADWAASVHGRRKAIVLLSEGISYDVTKEFSPDRLDASSLTAASLGLAIRDTTGAVTRADVNIYAIDTAGLTVESAVKDRARWFAQTNLQLLAENTGGFALTNSNNYGPAFDRVVRENSSYYVLTYSPAAARQRDGRYHRIRVRVKRDGVTARTRDGYLAPGARADDAPVLATDAGLSRQLENLMQSPLPVSGMPVRVSLAPFKGDGDRASILLTGEVPASAFAGREVALEVSYAAIDSAPAVRSSQTIRATLAAASPLLAQARQAGAAFARRFELAPGRYQVRVGARDGTRDVSGLVLYDLDVPDFSADGLAMSGVVLGLPRSRQVVMTHDDAVESDLGALPTVRRRLSAADEAALVYVEVYDRAPQPHVVTLSASLRGASGAPVFVDADGRRSQDPEGETHRYTVQIPLARVPAGDYVLTVEAAAGGRTAQRSIPITIEP